MKGIEQTATGWRAYIWIVDPSHPKGGYQTSRRFPANATVSEMKQWRNRRKYGEPDDEDAATFTEDALSYLQREKVKQMPSRKDRERQIRRWIAAFGTRTRASIGPSDIDRVLDQLRGRYAASSVNGHRTALMDLWTTLDGRHAANPVKASRKYAEPEPEPRAPALSAVLKIIKAMPTNSDYARKCRARIQVIAWTGWPHAVIRKVTEDALDLKHARAYVAGRRKGTGAAARWLPLLPEAVKALKEFHKEDAYGPFSNGSLHRKFKKARAAVHLSHVRPYDFRHFFGTLIATITRDERAVQDLMLLSTAKMVQRYTRAATDPRTQAAVRDVAKELPTLLRDARRIAGRAGGRVGRVSLGQRSASVRKRPRQQRKTLSKS